MMQLCCWFSSQDDQLIKDTNFFSCTQSESNKYLAVLVTVEDEVSFTNKYSLSATINHPGTLNRGHYRAFIRDLHSSSWYSCNAKLVFNLENSFNNTASYILFSAKFKCSPGSTKTFPGFARGFCHFRLCLRVWQPQIQPESSIGIEFAHSIFRHYNPAVLCCNRSIARRLDQMWPCQLILRIFCGQSSAKFHLLAVLTVLAVTEGKIICWSKN